MEYLTVLVGVDELCSEYYTVWRSGVCEYYICVSTEQLCDEYLTVLEEWMSYVVSIISV